MKRRSLNRIQSSGSDDEDSAPGSATAKKEWETSHRSSDRLKTRANRQFRLPSRDEVLSHIIPKDRKETPSKSLAELRPRKLVNNFLKVNNRYNYNPDFTDSDTSLGGFLDDEDDKEEEGNSTTDGEDDEESSKSQTSSSSSEEEESHKHRHRSQGKQKLRDLRKREIFPGETDSESEDDEEKVCGTTKKRRRRQSSFLDDSSSNEDQAEEGRKTSCREESLKRKKIKQNFFEEYRAKRALRKSKV